KVTGNAINEDFSSYQGLLEELNNEFEVLDDEYQAASDEQKQDETFIQGLQTKANALYKKQESIDEEFVKSNPNSYVSLTILDEKASPENLNSFVKPAYEGLSNSLKTTDLGKGLGEKIANMEKLAVGAVA